MAKKTTKKTAKKQAVDWFFLVIDGEPSGPFNAEGLDLAVRAELSEGTDVEEMDIYKAHPKPGKVYLYFEAK